MIKNLIKYIFDKLGYQINAINKNYYGLKKFNFEIVLDIGANNGVSSIKFLSIFKNSKVYAFEPNSSHQNHLDKIKEKYNNRFFYRICGIGSKNGSLELNIHENHDPSSSFLSLSEDGTSEITEFTKLDLIKEHKVLVAVESLNNFFKKNNFENKRIFLKSDTQGFELEVLKGADEVLKFITVIQIEVDFLHFYESQPSAVEIINYLKNHNFSLRGFTYPPGLNSDGEIISSDFIFYNNNL